MCRGGDAIAPVATERNGNATEIYDLKQRKKKQASEADGGAAARRVTLAELAKHNTKEDCWFSIRGSVRCAIDLVLFTDACIERGAGPVSASCTISCRLVTSSLRPATPLPR